MIELQYLGRIAVPDKPLLLPSSYNFSCSSCSHCCRAWTISISPDVEEILHNTDWGAAGEQLAGVELFTKLNGTPCFAKQDDGACIFLTDDNLCIIHKHLGEDKKSLVCRIFPFSFVNTPDATHLFISFACPSVIANQGNPLETQRDYLQMLAAKSPAYSLTLPDQVRLTRDCKVGWAAYPVIEEGFQSFFSDTRHSRYHRLLAGHFFLERIIAKTPSGSTGEEAAKMISTLRTEETASFWEKAEALEPEPRQRQNLLRAAVIGPRELSYKNTIRSILTSMKIVFSTGTIRLDTIGVTVKPKLIDQVSTSLFRDGELPALDRYLEHFLFRKSLLFPNPMLDNYRFLLLSLSLIKWYAAVNAVAEERATASEDDFNKGIEIVERHYVSHSRYYKSLLDRSTTSMAMQMFFNNPRFPATSLAEYSS